MKFPVATSCALALCWSVSAHAQLIDGGACVQIEDAAQRLACFDSSALRAGYKRSTESRPAGISAIAPPQSALPGPAVAAPASSDALAAPVGTYKTREARAEERQEGRSSGADGIEAGLANHKLLRDGKVQVTLTNGQIWRQISGPRVRIAPGRELTVQIEPSSFGGFWMTIERGGGAVRAERIR